MASTPKAPRLPPFEQVLERYGADVWRFAAAQLGPAQADDVFQETMLAALAAYPSVRKPASVRSWLLRIAARKAIDAVRGRAREAVPVPEVRSAGPVPGPEPPEEELWARVRALPPKQRQAVALRTVWDLPYDQIASTMRTSAEAARRNVHEALKTLREEVADEDSGAH